MVNKTNEKCFMLWGVCVFMFIDPFKIELLDFCEEFLRIASLTSHLLINITAGCFFLFVFFCFCCCCGSLDTKPMRFIGGSRTLRPANVSALSSLAHSVHSSQQGLALSQNHALPFRTCRKWRRLTPTSAFHGYLKLVKNQIGHLTLENVLQ